MEAIVRGGRQHGERGFMMVALLVLLAVMAIMLGAALPAWNTMARREREAELVFRGEQYARAITLFQRQYAGAFPPSIDALLNGDRRFLRKKYKDPITNDDFEPIAVGSAVRLPGQTSGTATVGPGGTVTAGRGGITINSAGGGRGQPQSAATGQQGGGARGRAGGTLGQVGPTAGIMGVTSKSDRASLRLYKGADHYNQWLFIATLATNQAGGRGAQNPQDGRGGPGRGNPRGGGPARPGGPPPAGPFGPIGPGGGGGRGRGRL
jgi:type II secretory pathway pseudopilin PulG